MAQTVCLVTGASSGIGAEFARALASRGHHLVLTARREAQLAELAETLRRHRVDVHVVPCDLAEPDGVDTLTAAIGELGLTVEWLVNNAGFGSYGRFAELPLERELAMIDLNVRALVALSGRYLPDMLARGRGTILHVASTTSYQPVPYMAVYGGTKAFVLSFSEAVARECVGSGVRVLAVCPGHTPTEFQQTSGVDRRPTRTSAQSVESVVREALAALNTAEPFAVVTGWPNKVTTQAARVLPRRALSWLLGRAFRPKA